MSVEMAAIANVTNAVSEALAQLELPLTTPDYPGLDLQADQSSRIVAASITLMVLSGIAVGMRFIARHLSRAGLWWDDWTILVAMLISWAACGCMIATTRYGFGRHIAAEGSLANRKIAAYYWFKIFYIYESIYTISITCIKVSILLFYSRIFKERPFQIALWLTLGVTLAWFVAVELAVIFECHPIYALWTFTPNACVDLHKFVIGSGVPNVLLNTVILMLPVPMIWTLDIQNRHKLVLSGVFMLGGFIVIVSIIRLIIIHQFEQVDITWTYVDAGIWTSVEPTIGVCSACLPILRALWVWRRPQSSVQRSAQKSPRTVAEPKPAQPVDRPRAEHVRGSSSASRYPLNELSSESMMGWGKHVSLSSSGHERGSPSDASDIAMDDLAGRAEEPQPAKKKKKHKRDPSSILRIKPIAELYG